MSNLKGRINKLKQNKLIRVSWLILRCVYRFGLFLGIKVFRKLTQKSEGELISLKLRGSEPEIFIRSNSSDTSVFETVFIAKRFAISDKNLVPKLIIDAGANIGLVSLFYAKRYPDSLIYAIEPEQSNYDLLVKNAFCYKNIIPIRAALWKDKSLLYIDNPYAEKWSYQVSNRKEYGKPFTPSITVPEILCMSRMNFIDIFKIDIEGSEKFLFEENYETWINKIGMIIIELHEKYQKGAGEKFYSSISNLSFREKKIGENHFITLN